MDPYYYSGASGTQSGDYVRETNSFIPHLPVYYGYVATHGTFRFFSVIEQVLTVIGEGKHGLWRIHDNGHVREYLASGEVGLEAGSDVMDEALFDTINASYSHFLEDESWSGYKYPDQEFSEDGNTMNWVDLPISHPKYQGKYDDHPPIDLPHFYCTMSQHRFPFASEVWEFLSAQPKANEIGPLGIRAGLDIKELYPNVVRLEHFPDARTWINVGVGDDETDYYTQQSFDAGTAQTVNYQAADTSKTAAEYYMIERPFFNEPYLFITAVFENEDNDDFSYIRPDGLYYQHLLDRGYDNIKTTVTENPRFHLESYGDEEAYPAIGTPLYGVNHPNRREALMNGGACPLRGGDWAYYPFGNAGAGWPTNYEEISPLCDAVIIDVKCWYNLAVDTWNDPNLFLGNAGFGTENVTYFMDANLYGFYSDPYLENFTNPYAIDMTSDGEFLQSTDEYETVQAVLQYPAVEPTVTVVPIEPCFDSTTWYKFGKPRHNFGDPMLTFNRR